MFFPPTDVPSHRTHFQAEIDISGSGERLEIVKLQSLLSNEGARGEEI